MIKILKQNSKISNNLLKKQFVLYIPTYKLNFINHDKYGKVYPVYIADSDYMKRSNPKKLMPIMITLSSLNLFILLSGLQILPMTNLFSMLYMKNDLLIILTMMNLYWIRKYFKYLLKYKTLTKALFMLPDGKSLILETYSEEINRLDIYDIYSFSISSKLENPGRFNWLVNNDNSFYAHIDWGRTKFNYFEGKRVLLDYEIFKYIINRYYIETKQVRFDKLDDINYYKIEDKSDIRAYYTECNFKQYTIERIKSSNNRRLKLLLLKKLHQRNEANAINLFNNYI